MSKKVLLANIYSGLYHGRWIGLAPYILRAYARQFEIGKQYEITVCQFHNEDSIEDVVDKINTINPDIIGLSLYVYNSKKTLEVISRMSCHVVLGGPHVTGVEKELLAENKNVSVIVTGEGEKPFVQLLEHFAGQMDVGKIPGVTTRESHVAPGQDLVDLNTIPSVYQEIVDDLTVPSNVCFETSRGCPYKCGYCAWSYDSKMRYYDLERVLKDLDIVCSNKNVKIIQSADSSLFCNRKRAKVILQHLILLNPRQEFFFELHIEHVDDELIDLMAKLPNQEFSFGIQAVDEQTNRQMGRTFNQNVFKENFSKMAHKLTKAQLHVDILFPLPGDTLQGFKRSIEFALNLEKVHFIKFNSLILLPGSEFFRNRSKYGFVLRDEDTRLVESCNTFSKEDLKNAIKYANYAVVLHSNSCFKECMKKFARDRGLSIIDAFEEILDTLPFDLFDGEKLPEMITAKMTDDELLLRLAPAYFNFSRMVKFFRTQTIGKYDDELKGWNKSFLPTGHIKAGLLLKLVVRRIKMFFISHKNRKVACESYVEKNN